MRQRTISDYFWRDPEISDLSQEDKATLLYFLTSPSSNIIGVYQIVWMIAAAEMGWTKDQLLVVVKRLKAKMLIDCNDAGWIWVKIWWKHNSAAGAFSPKLLQNARKQCAAIPSEWLDEFLESLKTVGVDRVLIGYSYPIPYPSDTLPPNSISNSNPNTTTTTTSEKIDHPEPIHRNGANSAPLAETRTNTVIESTGANSAIQTEVCNGARNAGPELPGQNTVVVDLIFPPSIQTCQHDAIRALLSGSGVSPGHWQTLIDELHGAQLAKPVTNPVGYVRRMAERMSAGSFTPERAPMIAEQRKRREANEKQAVTQARNRPDCGQPSQAQLDRLPQSIRESLARLMTQS